MNIKAVHLEGPRGGRPRRRPRVLSPGGTVGARSRDGPLRERGRDRPEPHDSHAGVVPGDGAADGLGHEGRRRVGEGPPNCQGVPPPERRQRRAGHVQRGTVGR